MAAGAEGVSAPPNQPLLSLLTWNAVTLATQWRRPSPHPRISPTTSPCPSCGVGDTSSYCPLSLRKRGCSWVRTEATSAWSQPTGYPNQFAAGWTIKDPATFPLPWRGQGEQGTMGKWWNTCPHIHFFLENFLVTKLLF